MADPADVRRTIAALAQNQSLIISMMNAKTADERQKIAARAGIKLFDRKDVDAALGIAGAGASPARAAEAMAGADAAGVTAHTAVVAAVLAAVVP